MEEKVLEKLTETVAQLFKKPIEELSGSTTFDSLGAKSVNIVQVIAVLEEEYDVEIPFMQFRRNKTLADAAAYVADLCNY